MRTIEAAAPIRVSRRPVRRAPTAWAEFTATPLRMRAYLSLVAGLAAVLPLAARPAVHPASPEWLTVAGLIAVSVLNVEVSRRLSGGLAQTQQPHKALSAWAFAAALLLPTPWLLVVVPLTYAHARWRGLRVVLWKWIGSACYLVLAGYAAAQVRPLVLGADAGWMSGDGGRGVLAVLLAGAVFLAVEALLFAGSATLNDLADERWLRAMLTSPGFYLTEAGVLLVGGLLSAVWFAAPWFTLLFVPIYVLVQHAVLLAPLRERAAAVAELAEANDALARRNADLKEAHQLKVDLLGMLGHELGNPLTSIEGYAQIGADAYAEGDHSTVERSLEVVLRNSGQMRAVLLDVLGLVTREQGGLVATPEPCPVRPRLLHALAQIRTDDLPDLDCPPGLTAMVQPGHLDQILANLVSNAAKYGHGVTAVRAQQVPGGIVEVTVSDSGPGVSGPLREHLFERFRRGERDRGAVPGTGIGLFISRELARANGGDLVYRDAPGAGAAFSLRLVAD